MAQDTQEKQHEEDMVKKIGNLYAGKDSGVLWIFSGHTPYKNLMGYFKRAIPDKWNATVFGWDVMEEPNEAKDKHRIIRRMFRQ